ncbi:MAG: cupin domain-containing protein [Myxococcales bacterium]|nr:cupin domain-containing protein [Myxococcales bacterium]MDD9968624.1 cupin domain-containing protein [Myxococcales bacterium]
MGEKEPKAKYIAVDSVEYQPLSSRSGVDFKRLLRSEALEVGQTRIGRTANLDEREPSPSVRLAYVLRGRGLLRQRGEELPLSAGDLLVVPAGTPWGPQVSVLSEELVLLEIAAGSRRTDGRQAHPTHERQPAPLRRVRPEEVPPYEPAGHAKTTNRCLYIDDELEVIEGFIDAGGGAERHYHEHNEQVLYLLEAREPLLIHYPRRAPHGTGGGLKEALKLLVVYAPPLGESQNALA